MEDAKTECRCFVHHVNDPESRAAVKKNLDYARSIGDRQGTMIAMMMLTGPCPARSSAQVS